jgi:hypothetical protein
MSCRTPFALAILAAACLGLPGRAADLADHGPHGEFFHDAASGLYWLDPAVLVGNARATVALLADHCPGWSLATSIQIDGLLGRTGPAGEPLTAVLGPHQIDISGYRWLGFYAEPDPDGWLVQTTNGPAYDTVTETGSQGGAASLNTGAWFVSTIDPVTAPRLEDCGDAGEFFLDHATQLYWRDPERFVGLTRIEVEAWLADHPLWRWATAAEVFGLACRLTVGDVPLTAVLGEPQFWATGAQPRWIGYYDQAAEPDGVVLQATYGPPFVMATFVGTQGGAAAWNPGAWVVTSSDPTPTAPTSWSGVKRHFR